MSERIANADLPRMSFGQFVEWVLKQMAANDENGCEFEIDGFQVGKDGKKTPMKLAFDIRLREVQ